MAGAAAGGGCFGRQFDSSPLLGDQACAQVDMTTELDYLTQVGMDGGRGGWVGGVRDIRFKPLRGQGCIGQGAWVSFVKNLRSGAWGGKVGACQIVAVLGFC